MLLNRIVQIFAASFPIYHRAPDLPKKTTGIRDVKRYLQIVTIGNNGLLVVKKSTPFQATQNLIVLPRHVVFGLVTALHLRFQHPTAFQLRKLFHRYFFALDADHVIDSVTKTCSQCVALAQLPSESPQFSTSPPDPVIGSVFACDVLARARQKIMVVREVLTSFTVARLIPNEQTSAIRDALIECTADLRSQNGATFRTDGGPAFQSLSNDRMLQSHGISIEIGRLHNKNKNLIAEKCIHGLECELKRLYPDGGPVTAVHLSLAVTQLDGWIRNRGLSSKELLFQ